MKTIYVAGPMRGYPQWNFPAFDLNAEWLRDNGWDAISPADLDREIGFDETDDTAVFTAEDFANAMRRDYAALLECDAIAFIPGWEKSTGAALERDFGTKLGLEFYRIDATRNYFEKEVVVGLTGFAQVGKDTLAQELVKHLGFERHGFADALKSILYALNPRVELYNNDFIGHWHVQTLVDQKGWEEAKKEPEVRELLQRLGTEGGRVALGKDVWVNTLFTQPTGPRIVIPDVRFENEAQAIRARGGSVIRIHRPGTGPINAHISDQIDFEADYEVVNDRTPFDAYYEILGFLEDRSLDLVA